MRRSRHRPLFDVESSVAPFTGPLAIEYDAGHHRVATGRVADIETFNSLRAFREDPELTYGLDPFPLGLASADS